MVQRLNDKQVDDTIQAAMDSLPEQERHGVDNCVADLSGTIRGLPGGRHFGVKRARELVFALGLFLNRTEA